MCAVFPYFMVVAVKVPYVCAMMFVCLYDFWFPGSGRGLMDVYNGDLSNFGDHLVNFILTRCWEEENIFYVILYIGYDALVIVVIMRDFLQYLAFRSAYILVVPVLVSFI